MEDLPLFGKGLFKYILWWRYNAICTDALHTIIQRDHHAYTREFMCTWLRCDNCKSKGDVMYEWGINTWKGYCLECWVKNPVFVLEYPRWFNIKKVAIPYKLRMLGGFYLK